MDTILHTQPDTHKKEETFDSAIEKLREKIKGLQKTVHSQQELNQLNAIPLLVNKIESIVYHLMDQHEKLDSEFQELAFKNERCALWKRSIDDVILFACQLPDRSLRKALERLHERMCWSINDPLPDKHQITIGL